MNEEKCKTNVIGEIKDIITYEDGTVEETEWGRNLVVDTFNTLLSGMLKGDITQGIKYWAVGSGLDTWDTTQPEPQKTDTKCKTEIYRKILPTPSITYVDTEGNTTAYPTNRLQITLFFDKGQATGKWREFCIFGGDGATSTKDTGLALNHRIHGLIDKTENMTVERVLRFTFL